MTIIAAAEDNNGYWIASDSHGNTGNTCVELGGKLINKGKYIVGFSNSYRVRDVIIECNTFPKTMNSIKSVRKFRDVLKELMLEDGCLGVGIEGDTVVHPVSLIIVSPSGLYELDSDYQVHKYECGYAAIGSGSDVALGTLRAMLRYGATAEQAVHAAVEASIYHCTTCGGDIHINYFLKNKK